VKIKSALLIVFLSIMTAGPVCADGYDLTMSRWTKMTKQRQQYSDFLEGFYAQIYASVQNKSKAPTEFCQKLLVFYPKSTCGGSLSYFVQDNNTEVVFTQDFKVLQIIQQMDNMKRTLGFNPPTYSVTNGVSKATVRYNLTYPTQSSYDINIPSMAKLASTLWRQRPDELEFQQNSLSPLSGILNDVYHYRLSKIDDLSMDVMVDRILTEPDFRQYVIENANLLYQHPEIEMAVPDIEYKIAVPYAPETGIKETPAEILPPEVEYSAEPNDLSANRTDVVFQYFFFVLIIAAVVTFCIFSFKLSRSVKIAKERRRLKEAGLLEPEIPEEPIIDPTEQDGYCPEFVDVLEQGSLCGNLKEGEKGPCKDFIETYEKGVHCRNQRLQRTTLEPENIIETAATTPLPPIQFSEAIPLFDRIYAHLNPLAEAFGCFVVVGKTLSAFVNQEGTEKEKAWWHLFGLDPEFEVDFVIADLERGLVVCAVFLTGLDKQVFDQDRLKTAMEAIEIKPVFISDEDSFDIKRLREGLAKRLSEIPPVIAKSA